MRKRIGIFIIPIAVLATIALLLVGCGGKTDKGDGYEISNQTMKVDTGDEANVVIKGTFTNTKSETETPIIVWSINDKDGKRLAFASYTAENLAAGSSVDFEATLMPLIPRWYEKSSITGNLNAYGSEDYEMSIAGFIGLTRSILDLDSKEFQDAFKNACDNAASFELENVFFAKEELRRLESEINNLDIN